MNMRHSTCLFAIALTLTTLRLSDHAAAAEKPAVEVVTTLIEASASIDGSLKAFPGLYDNLLAEARRELAKQRAQAVKDRKETPDMFDEGRHYTYERNYALRSHIGRYVTVLRADYMNGLGAHPNHLSDTILWDTEAKKRISVRPFFKEAATGGPALQTLADAIRAALVVAKKERGVEDAETDTGLDSIKPDLTKLGALALAPSSETGKCAGFVAYFSPYAVGPYAEGDYSVFVPWTAFKDHLSPEGVALFGGERLAGDDKND
jgi:hypothetical protein